MRVCECVCMFIKHYLQISKKSYVLFSLAFLWTETPTSVVYTTLLLPNRLLFIYTIDMDITYRRNLYLYVFITIQRELNTTQLQIS